MMNQVFFAQCVCVEATKSRELFPLSYLTNKNPCAFASVSKIKTYPQATQARFYLTCFSLPARQPKTSTLIEIWPYQDLGLNRTYRPLTGGSIGCSTNDQRSKLPRNSWNTTKIRYPTLQLWVELRLLVDLLMRQNQKCRLITSSWQENILLVLQIS